MYVGKDVRIGRDGSIDTVGRVQRWDGTRKGGGGEQGAGDVGRLGVYVGGQGKIERRGVPIVDYGREDQGYTAKVGRIAIGWMVADPV